CPRKCIKAVYAVADFADGATLCKFSQFVGVDIVFVCVGRRGDAMLVWGDATKLFSVIHLLSKCARPSITSMLCTLNSYNLLGKPANRRNTLEGTYPDSNKISGFVL